jgi:hypothetical protein
MGFKLDSKKATITVFRNEKKLGLAYTLKDKKIVKNLWPCIDCYYQDQSLELIKFKGK